MPDDNIPSEKYRDTGIPRCFVTSLIVLNNFSKIVTIARKTKTWIGCSAAESVLSNNLNFEWNLDRPGALEQLFCFCGLDLDLQLLTVLNELDIHILKLYLAAKNPDL